MATTKHHVEYSKIDSSGNVKILYPKNTLEDVYINSSSTATLVNKVNFYGTCSTAQATAAKVVSGTGFTSANLVAGTHVTVKFTYAAVAGATLNVDSTGAKAIYKNNAAVTAAGWPANAVVTFVYDGTYWQIDGNWSASTSSDGLMTTTMVSKLNGIASGANNYVHPTSSGNKHIPSGGSSGQILRWSADGTAAWGSDNNTTYSAGAGIGLTNGAFYNAGVRSIEQGTSNGTIRVNTNGAFANVDVKGLAAGAYTSTYAGSSSAGGAATSASKLGTSTVGGTTTPIYLNAGVPTACSEFTKKSDFDTLVGKLPRLWDKIYQPSSTSTTGWYRIAKLVYNSSSGEFHIDVNGGSGSMTTIVLQVGAGSYPSIIQTSGSAMSSAIQFTKVRLTRDSYETSYLELYTPSGFSFLNVDFSGHGWESVDGSFVAANPPYKINERNLLYGDNLSFEVNNLLNGQILPVDTGYVKYVTFYNSYMKKIGNLINLRIELSCTQVSIPANSKLSIGAVKTPYTPAINTRIGIIVPNIDGNTVAFKSPATCIIEASGEIVLYMGSAALDFCFINFTYII